MSYSPVIQTITRDAFEKLSNITIEQKVEAMEAIVQNFVELAEFPNRYVIKDANTKEKYFDMVEKSNPFCRWCCHPIHQLDLITKSKSGDFAFILSKPFKCFKCFNLSPLCLAEMRVLDTKGAQVALAKERACSCVQPKIDIYNASGEFVDSAHGPSFCFGGCLESCQKVQFKFDESGIVISKHGDFDATMVAIQNTLTDADNYSIKIKKNTPYDEKAAIIAATLLLDYMFFEGDETSLNQGLTCCTFYLCGCNGACRLQPENNRV